MPAVPPPLTPEKPAPFRETRASVLLDLVRGLAAMVVLADHTHNLFFVDAGRAMQASAHPRLTLALYALVSAGIQAVVVFFVLSGFLISGSVFRALERNRFTWREYLTHRLVRLWVVLLPALLLCALWESGSLAVMQGTGFHGFLEALRLRSPDQHLTWSALVGNVFFLQTIRVPMFGSNRVLWSLAFEFWYYILFPLGALALWKGTPLARRILYVGLFVAVAAVAGRSVLGLFPVWLMGTMLAWLKPPTLPRAVRVVAAILYAPMLFVLAITRWTSHFFKQDYVLGLLTLLFFWIVLSARRRSDPQSFATRLARTLGAFSYSLYLVHYPLLFFIATWLLRGRLWYPDARHVATGATLALVAMGYAYLVASMTEFRNDRVRDWVAARVGLHRRA